MVENVFCVIHWQLTYPVNEIISVIWGMNQRKQQLRRSVTLFSITKQKGSEKLCDDSSSLRFGDNISGKEKLKNSRVNEKRNRLTSS